MKELQEVQPEAEHWYLLTTENFRHPPLISKYQSSHVRGLRSP